MSLPMELLAYFTRIVVAILLNSLWQGAAIALVTWGALRLFPKTNASTRYAAWCLALIAMVVVPVVTSVSTVSVAHSGWGPYGTIHTSSQMGTRTIHRETSIPWTTRSWSVGHTEAPPAKPSVLVPPRAHLTIPQIAAWIVFALWLIAALIVLIRLAVALWQLEHLKRDSLPLNVEYRDAMERWQCATKGSRDVRICVSDDIDVPIAVGLFDAMVLLPSHLVESLEPSEVDQISLHELAHLLRNDDWTNGLQRVISALFFFNPAVWLAARQMDIEREVACDDYVLELTGAVRPYAYCLTKMAEMTPWPHRALAAPGVFVTRKNISIRIERLLRTGRAIGSSIAPSVATAVIIGIAAICIIVRTVTPSIAYTLPASTQVAQAMPTPVHSAAPAPAHAPAAHKASASTHQAPAAHPAPAAHAAPAHTAIPVGTPTPLLGVSPPRPPVAQTGTVYEMQKQIGQQVTPEVNKAVSSAVDASLKNTLASVRNGLLPLKNGLSSAKNRTVAANDNNDGCTGCDYSRANLSGKDFSNRSFTGSDFSNANLQNVRFDHAQLNGTDFSHANLRNASFVGAHMEGCDLRGADVTGARFDGATMTGCDINVSALSPTQARALLDTCTGCNFEHANFEGMDLRGVHLTGTNFAHANLRNANMSGAVMSGVNFDGATLVGANVDGAQFNGCNFSHVDLRGVDLSKASMTGSAMHDAIFHD